MLANMLSTKITGLLQNDVNHMASIFVVFGDVGRVMPIGQLQRSEFGDHLVPKFSACRSKIARSEFGDQMVPKSDRRLDNILPDLD